MRFTATLVVTACVLLSAGTSAGGAEQEEPQQPEAFLWDWVRGKAKFDLYTSFHEWASDVHRRDTEQFEVGVKALTLREEQGAKRAALAGRLVAHWNTARLDAAERERVIHVLGRLCAVEGLPLIIEQTKADSAELQVAAIRALGFFGNAPAKESYIVYGGRVRIVVLASNHSADATRALLDVLETSRTLRAPRGVPPGLSSAERRKVRRDARWAFRERMGSLSWVLIDALRSHRTEAVARRLVQAMEAPGELRLSMDSVRDVLALGAHKAGVSAIVEGVEERSVDVRTMIAQALGWSARREAVVPLLTLLGDKEATVVSAARAALARLAGMDAPPAASDAAYWMKRLGPDGARLDLSKAPRPEDLKPGVYKLGA